MSEYKKYKESHLKAQKKYDEKHKEERKERDKKRYNSMKKCKNEIERLNNIIDELEKYLKHQYLEWKDCETDVKFMAHEDKAILDKLKELKEGK